MADYSSGQRGETVNLLPTGFGSSNLSSVPIVAMFRAEYYDEIMQLSKEIPLFKKELSLTM